MAKSKLVKANQKIADSVAGGYKKIERGVVGGYKKIENGEGGGIEIMKMSTFVAMILGSNILTTALCFFTVCFKVGFLPARLGGLKRRAGRT